jgi:polyisoprenoid-binding protein YceI
MSAYPRVVAACRAAADSTTAAEQEDTTTSSNPTSTVQVPTVGRYRVDPLRSSVRYRGRHMFGFGGVEASLTLTAGTIVVADPTTESTVELTIDPASFTSDKARRDRHVKSQSLLHVEQYREIVFRSTQVRTGGDRWLVTGDVTAHGVTQPTVVTVDRAAVEGSQVTLHSVAQLDKYDFGVTKVKGIAGRQVTLDFNLVAVAE